MMSGILSRNTKPEMLVRKFLHAEGFRYRLNVRALPGTPDIVLPRWKTLIFVNGCFWHRHPCCSLAYTPKTRQAFWLEKFEKNIARDETAVSFLKEAGWHVIVVWECTLRAGSRQATLSALAQEIRDGTKDDGSDS